MIPQELTPYLPTLLSEKLQLSLMLWGPPGIGKSSIVAGVAQGAGMKLVDLRLSQLAPTDLRGLPVADKGVSRWYPPEFLPTEGESVLFLDEMVIPPIGALITYRYQELTDRGVPRFPTFLRVRDDLNPADWGAIVPAPVSSKPSPATKTIKPKCA